MISSGHFIEVPPETNTRDTLRFDKNRKKGTGEFSIFRFQDRDTAQIIYYCPSLEITGYGENDHKAQAMIKDTLDSYLRELMKLPMDILRDELTKLGWKRNMFRNKEYSRTSVDIHGELKNFNADEGSIRRVQLVA